MLAALPSIHTRAMESGTINPAALNAPGTYISARSPTAMRRRLLSLMACTMLLDLASLADKYLQPRPSRPTCCRNLAHAARNGTDHRTDTVVQSDNLKKAVRLYSIKGAILMRALLSSSYGLARADYVSYR